MSVTISMLIKFSLVRSATTRQLIPRGRSYRVTQNPFYAEDGGHLWSPRRVGVLCTDENYVCLGAPDCTDKKWSGP